MPRNWEDWQETDSGVMMSSSLPRLRGRSWLARRFRQETPPVRFFLEILPTIGELPLFGPFDLEQLWTMAKYSHKGPILPVPYGWRLRITREEGYMQEPYSIPFESME